MADDPNQEWLGLVQPVGLVVAPRVLSERGLPPEAQTSADTRQAAELIPEDGLGADPWAPDPWAIATTLLGWQPALVAGAPGGPALPDDLSVWVPEAETRLAPDWAVRRPGSDGFQLLAQILPAGLDPDARGALSGWEATPHQRLERLLRETDIPIGLLISDKAWRLVYAPKGETSGWIPFLLAPMRQVAGRPILAGFKLLLHRFRLFNDAEPRRLPALLAESRAAQAAVSTKLASQVLGALHDLLRGFNAADPARLAALARARPHHVYEGLLTVLLRLVFLLYAEDRDLIPSRNDAAARGLYQRGYGVRGLHAQLLEDAARTPDTMDERTGAWGRLLALFKLVHDGHPSGWIRGRGGALFDPARFPFLQGQDTPTNPIAIPALSDGTVLRVLDRLLVLEGEHLSYRTLDVEQIGSVYETVMGFDVLPAPGPALAIAAGKNNHTPVFLDLAALAAKKGKDRLKALKEEYSRASLTAKQAAPIEQAAGEAELAEALRPIVDERGSPGAAIVPAGTPLLQPNDERRRTGSHYTPRALTEPIVRHALEPAFARLGEAATPEDVLALKLCDPAMGSGAFLVEACRQLATRLAQAWARHPGTRPALAADEDEELLARRLVAQRSLYGVDRNPLATTLARLSLWLATLARDHEFTFLDHALKSGDSLVGLTAKQIGTLRWQEGQSDVAPFGGFLREMVRKVTEGRRAIREAPDDIAREMQESRFREIETWTQQVRWLGDATLAAFFGEAKPKAREIARKRLGVTASLAPEFAWPKIREAAAQLAAGPFPIRPFHWEIEFPEVFAGDDPGFDALVGNPPFAGKNTLINGHRAHYLGWLQTLHEGAHGNADLGAHFFRRAFGLLRASGCFGLIATNTISQGDTRETGLRAIIAAGGTIQRAVMHLPWPGEAKVTASVVHIRRGPAPSPVLDERPVRRISAYLVEGDLDRAPERLTENARKAFIGSYILGAGFTFDDAAAAKGESESLDTMRVLTTNDAHNAERIFPYIGGEEVNTSPTHAHHRYVIDFADFPLRRNSAMRSWFLNEGSEACDERRKEWLHRGIVPSDYPAEVAEDWPNLLEIVDRRVKPQRIKLPPSNAWNRSVEKYWWRWGAYRKKLNRALIGLNRYIFIPNISPHLLVAFIKAGVVTGAPHNVVAFPNQAPFCVIQSRPHEVWARFFASTLEDRLRYTPSDCFETFPFPEDFETLPTLEATGQTYHDHRAALMVTRNEGLTKTYNHFHDPAETVADIVRLRQLHHEMDVAVLRAYGWDDLAERAAPQFLTEESENDHRYQNRLFWPAPFRDEVLARLLDLNRSRAAEERRQGLTPLAAEDIEDETE